MSNVEIIYLDFYGLKNVLCTQRFESSSDVNTKEIQRTIYGWQYGQDFSYIIIDDVAEQLNMLPYEFVQ